LPSLPEHRGRRDPYTLEAMALGAPTGTRDPRVAEEQAEHSGAADRVLSPRLPALRRPARGDGGRRIRANPAVQSPGDRTRFAAYREVRQAHARLDGGAWDASNRRPERLRPGRRSGPEVHCRGGQEERGGSPQGGAPGPSPWAAIGVRSGAIGVRSNLG